MLGMPGRIGSEWVAGINRNQWPEWLGIRTQTLQSKDFSIIGPNNDLLQSEFTPNLGV
jgi:hypothetical protein